MSHNSGFLQKQNAIISRKIEENCSITRQQMMDAAIIAAAEVFGMGKGRAKRFYDAVLENMREMCRLTDNDGTEELWELKEKLDRRLKAIVGEENFCPWEDRYDFSSTPKMFK